jgi:hypothetical protein
MDSQQQIRELLQKFQDGYTRRDLGAVDEFMDLFTADAEVIGTNGVKPGVDEWYVSRASARELVAGDWEGWGDLRLDLDAASVHSIGDVGWIAATATVSQRIGEENYAAYLKFVTEYLEQSDASPREKLHYILRGGTNTVYELSRGENFVWALRLTAVVVREPSGWKFAQMNFSFPTIYFPDVRITE